MTSLIKLKANNLPAYITKRKVPSLPLTRKSLQTNNDGKFCTFPLLKWNICPKRGTNYFSFQRSSILIPEFGNEKNSFYVFSLIGGKISCSERCFDMFTKGIKTFAYSSHQIKCSFTSFCGEVIAGISLGDFGWRLLRVIKRFVGRFLSLNI